MDILNQQPNIDLAMLDFAMPGMNGVEVVRQIRFKKTTLLILFMTGYADKNALGEISEVRFVRKPFVADDLATKIRHTLAKV